ncbi:MAG: serine protease [Proteobacteria bacterium]|nr:serine protease [Pseudomonadota bacterium]
MSGVPRVVSTVLTVLTGLTSFTGLRLAIASLSMIAALAALAPPAVAAKDTGSMTVDKLLQAVVKVHTRVPAEARTARGLGTEREGSGVIIAKDGLIVTIGYLILEAIEIEVVDHRGRTRPAEFVGYDHDSGFGLIRMRDAGGAEPLEFGDSAKLAERQPVMVATFAGAKDAIPAVVVSRREFAGYWEYLLDKAIFTSPPHYNWGGAALIGADGRLLGIGSLIVGDAVKGEQVPGNMFVPIDLLKPIMGDLLTKGRAARRPKPWLGMHTEEVRGRLFVTRVTAAGPAEKAGIEPGDIVIGIGDAGVSSMADLYRKVWALGKAGVEVPLKILHGADVQELVVHSADRYQFLKLRPSY